MRFMSYYTDIWKIKNAVFKTENCPFSEQKLVNYTNCKKNNKKKENTTSQLYKINTSYMSFSTSCLAIGKACGHSSIKDGFHKGSCSKPVKKTVQIFFSLHQWLIPDNFKLKIHV